MFPKRSVCAALALVLLWISDLRGAGPKSPPQIDITSYNATADDATDDTAAIQKALAVAIANAPCELVIPRGTFIVQDPTSGSYPAAADGPINLPPGTRDVLIRGENATLKIGPNGVSTSVIRIYGARDRVTGITIDADCNESDSASKKAKGNSGFEINGSHPTPSTDDATDCYVYDCHYINGYRGTVADPNGDDAINQGCEGFLAVNATRSGFADCTCNDSTWQGFLVGGDDIIVAGCRARNFRGNGLRIQQGSRIYVSNFVADSDRCHGRGGILADAGSTGDERTDLVELVNCYVTVNPDGTGLDPTGNVDGPGTACKVASCRKVVVIGGYYEAGDATNNTAFRLEDSLADFSAYEATFNPNVGFTTSDNDHSSVYQGLIASVADDGNGFCQFTLSASSAAGTRLTAGKSLFVHGSAVTSYNREHIVTAMGTAPTYVATTNIPYNGSAIGSVAFARSGVDSARFYGCTFGGADFGSATSNQSSSLIYGVSARVFEMEACRAIALEARTTSYNCIDWLTNNDAGFELLRLVNNDWVANTDAASSHAVRMIDPDAAISTTTLITSGKIISHDNRVRNIGAGAAVLANAAAANFNRQILFSTDGESKTRFVWNAAPTTETRTVFAPGDVVSQITVQGSIDWQCFASAVSGTSTNSFSIKSAPYRFVGTADGTPVADFDANEEVSATPTGVGEIRFGGLRSMSQGEGVRFSASGVYSTTGTPTLNFGMAFGKSQIGNGAAGSPVGTAAETGRTKIMEVGSFTTPSGASNRRWRIMGAGVIKTTGSSGVMTVTGTIAYETAADTWTTKEIGPTDVTVNTSNTTTHNRKMDVWATWGTKSPSNTFTCQQFEISPR